MPLPDASKLLSLPEPTWRALGDRLRALGLATDRTRAASLAGRRLPGPMRRPIRKWHLRQMQDPAGFAMRMLMYADPVTRPEADAAIGATLVAELLSVG